MRLLRLVLAMMIILMAGQASAQFLGQMSPASILPSGTGKIGGYFVGSDEADAVVGSIRYGFSQYTEGRFRFGFIDQDGKETAPHIILGLDAKYMLWKYSKSSPGGSEGSPASYNNPLDLSIGGFVEYSRLNFEDVISVGASAIGSIPYRLKNNSVIEPYARFNLRYQSVDSGDYFYLDRKFDGSSSSDFEFGLNLGALFSVTPLVDFTAEFQLDDAVAFMLGIDVAAF